MGSQGSWVDRNVWFHGAKASVSCMHVAFLVESILDLHGIELLFSICVDVFFNILEQSGKCKHNRVIHSSLGSIRPILFIIVVTFIVSTLTADSRGRSLGKTCLLTLWVHGSKRRLGVRSIVLLSFGSSLCSQHRLDLILESIWISDLSFVLVDHPENSKDIVKSQNTDLLSVVVPPSDLLLDHVLDLFIKLQIIHLLLQNVLVVEIKLRHIRVDILVNFLALKDHKNFSLASHFIHHIVDNISAKN